MWIMLDNDNLHTQNDNNYNEYVNVIISATK
jgi:hypothetical protein